MTKRLTLSLALAALFARAYAAEPIPATPLEAPIAANVTAKTAETSDGLAGWFYYKGIRLLEIRCEGAAVTASFLGEKEDFAPTSGAATPAYDTTYHGRLLGPNSVEFANDPLRAETFAKRLGVEPGAMQPDQLKSLQTTFPSDSNAVYSERWTLLPATGQLQVERSLPIPSYAPIPEETKLTDDLRQAIKDRSMGHFRRICGWKLTDPRERQAWQALDDQDYKKAAQLFRAVAEASPDRPFPFACLGEVNAHIGLKEFDAARKSLAQAYARMTAMDETRPFLEEYARLINEQIYSYETVALGKDLFEYLKTEIDKIQPQTDRATLAQKPFKSITEQEFGTIQEMLNGIDFWPKVEQIGSQKIRGRAPLLPLGQRALTLKGRGAAPLPNFIQYQMLAQSLVLRGDRGRKDGNTQLALIGYCGAIHLGQLMKHGPVTCQAVGAEMEKLGLRGLDESLEDGVFSDPGSVGMLRDSINYLYMDEPKISPKELICSDFAPCSIASGSFLEISLAANDTMLNYADTLSRVRENLTRLTLLKCGADLKAYLQIRGPFPDKLDNNGLPEDPFTTAPATLAATRIRYRPSGANAYFFSLGPAQTELMPPVPYDPTNGAVSPGYIVQGVK